MKREVLKSDVVSVQYDDDHHLAYIIWLGNPTLDKYKEPFQFLINELSKDHKIFGIVSDIRNQGVVGPNHRQWLYDEATPHAREKGVKYYGIVLDSNVFKVYYVNTLLKFLGNNDNVVRKTFQDFDKCDIWIKEKIMATEVKV